MDVIIDTELKMYGNLDTVSLYSHPKNQAFFYDYLSKLKLQRVIFNPETENLELIFMLEDNGTRAEVACKLMLLTTNQY